MSGGCRETTAWVGGPNSQSMVCGQAWRVEVKLGVKLRKQNPAKISERQY